MTVASATMTIRSGPPKERVGVCTESLRPGNAIMTPDVNGRQDARSITPKRLFRKTIDFLSSMRTGPTARGVGPGVAPAQQ